MGIIVQIHIADAEGGEATHRQEVELVARKGIVGDRYFSEEGGAAERQLTLIQTEAVQEFNRETGLSITTLDTRRNIATQGISLNDLVGEEFFVGAVLCKGEELCEPCLYLAGNFVDQIKPADFVKHLAHRGGLCAQILGDGIVRVGDTVDRSS